MLEIMTNKSLYNLHVRLFIIWISISVPLMSQTNEMGIFLGGSMFHGDVGYKNAEYSLLDTKPTIGISFKRNLNYHFGINLSLTRCEIYANDNSSIDFFNLNRNLHFKSKMTELAILLEFNFSPYLSRDADYNNSTFIFTGISRFYFNPQAQHSDESWYNLQPLATEGQGSDFYPTRDLYKLHGFAIPIGIGYKINIYEYITLSFNMSWRITFNDYIDNVSETYVEESILTTLAAELADQSYDGFTNGFQRGDSYSTDKYGFIGISILYSIKDPNNGCDNIVY